MEFDINQLVTEDTKTVKDNSNMGRPLKSKKTKQDKRLVVYLTEDEYDKFKFLANQEILSNSNYLRKLILEKINE